MHKLQVENVDVTRIANPAGARTERRSVEDARQSLKETVMLSSLRASLPNGVEVRITPNYCGRRQQGVELAAVAAHLSEMLDSRTGSERELLSFLENTTPAIFPEADSGSPVRITGTAQDRGVDLIFQTKTTPGFGVVQIKRGRLDPNRHFENDLQQIGRYVEQPAFGKPVNVAYVIAGRRHDLRAAALDKMAQGYKTASVPVMFLSWDDIVDRLSAEPSGDDEVKFEVVLVEIVKFSRKMLKTILSNPAMLAGIDDRKFEELIATLLYDLGVGDVRLTPARQDEGRDVIIEHLDAATGQRHKYLIECKHWVSGNKVTMRWAISLLEVVRQEEATGAILLSSSGFGPRLLEQEATLLQQGLFLKDQSDLLNWANVWERQYGSILMEPVDPKDVLGL